MKLLRLLSPIVLLTSALLPGQTSSLALRVQVSGTTQNISDGSTIPFAAEAIGRPLDALVSVTNRGTGTINITRVEVTGATDFSVSGAPAPETPIVPNDGFSMNIRFLPVSGLKVSGLVKIYYTDTPPSPPGGKIVNGIVNLNLTGVAPDYTFTYLPLPVGNSTPIQNGGTIVFPPSAVNATATATVVIGNRGSGPGAVGVISSTGSAFTLAALPNPPATIDPNKELRFAVQYLPTAIETSTGTVRIEFVDKAVTFNISGSSTGAVYTYEVIRDGTVAPLPSGGIVAVPDVNAGDKSTATVRFKNTGNADGKITAIGVQGTGFTLTDAPFLPATLTPGSTASVTVTFTSATPGRYTGRLRIGDDSFDVVSNALGSTLTYSYIAGPVTTTITGGGSVNFPAVAAGQTSTVNFVVTNSGTSAAPINSVGVLTTGTTFAVTGLPNLPASIAPGQSLSFGVTFTPATTGSLTGTLRVDSQSFALSGLGNQPQAIPTYKFTGASGAQQPAQQLSVGLSMDQTYPLTLRGTLTLTFNSEVFANDPAVQFATGGRTVSFSIPAGQKDAVFAPGQTQAKLQTGTVAGAIVLTPSFQSDGGIALTPTDPPAQTLTVAQSAPRLQTVQVTTKLANGFQLLITGYSTSRQLTQIDVTFTPTSGENVSTTKLTIPADASFNAWYQSTTSVQYGSQFTATIPISFTGDVLNVSTLADTVKSVAVTLTSKSGTSSSVSADVQ